MRCNIRPRLALAALFTIPCAYFLAEYLNLVPRLPAAAVLAVLLCLALLRHGWRATEKKGKEDLGILLFSAFLAAVLIVGRHIHVVEPYAGLLTENYIIGYSWRDLIALPFLTGGIAMLIRRLFDRLRARTGRLNDTGAVLKKRGLLFLGLAAWMMLAWTPYLLRFAPGFVFPDSTNSLLQALREQPLNNRNPILYTLFLRLCLFMGGARSGDVTLGCLLYSLCQMLVMAFSFSYLILWIEKRGALPRSWTLLLALLYGLSPYLAADTVAMWKDVIFSALVMLWSLMLADLALSGGELTENRGWRLRFFLCQLLLLFWRNNGVCAVLGTLAFLIADIRHRKRRGESTAFLLRVTALAAAGLVLWGMTVTLGYKLAGFGTPKEEVAGLQLNQMARVAAYEGAMSPEEREFLNGMLPLERYAATYRPCCVDMLKWDDRFEVDALRGKQFLKTWFSLLRKNPRLYAEAWALETYGFWTVNHPETNLSTRNITYGAPYNIKEPEGLDLNGYRLRFPHLLDGEPWASLIRADAWSIPLGILNWLLLLAGLFLLLAGQGQLGLALAPSLGIIAGLLVGTPISYLPRYELPVQLLAPLILLLLFGRRSGRESTGQRA